MTAQLLYRFLIGGALLWIALAMSLWWLRKRKARILRRLLRA